MCSEIRYVVAGEKRKPQHMQQSGNHIELSIRIRENLLKSYEALITEHRNIADQESYEQKLSYHVFEVCDLSSSINFVNELNEPIAAEKDADHVCSYLSYFMDHKVESHVRFLKMYLASTAYFKCKILVWWAADQICCERFNRVVLRYMVLGHTKFHPDALLSTIAHAY